MLNIIGEKLRSLRKKHKLDQKELGDKLGLSASTIGMYENDRRNPDVRTLRRLAEYFGVSVSFFFDEPRDTFYPEDLISKVPEEYRDLFKPENIDYIRFAHKMSKNDITPEQLEEIAKFVLTMRQK